MARLRIAPINFHDSAALTASTDVTPMGNFPIQNTQNDLRGSLYRSPDTADVDIDGTHSGGRKGNFFAMMNHRCHGGNIRIQLFSDDAWTTQIYDSGTNEVFPVVAFGVYEFGVSPLGVAPDDFYAMMAPYVIYFGAEYTYESYRITLTDQDDSYGIEFWEIGRLFIGKFFELSFNPTPGAELMLVDNTDKVRSRSGSLRTNQGGIWRTMTMDLDWLTDADRPVMMDIRRYCGTGRDFFLSLYPELGGRLERDHTINCKFATLNSFIRSLPSFYATKLVVEEV